MNIFKKSNPSQDKEKQKLEYLKTTAKMDLNSFVDQELFKESSQLVQHSFILEKEIEVELSKLSNQLEIFNKQSNDWIALEKSLNAAVKELGDLPHFTKLIERDIQEICLTLK
ncbi:GCN5-like 1 [Globomyces pollinis-pini]|nr:GCN5-like 1 [Globomyces pollinis-pini]